MANFTAADVKALREETGAGMMDVKNALVEADGDKDKALEIIRLKGLKSLSKREGREATAGLIVAEVSEDGKSGVMIEVNSETDFVSKSQKFIDFANEVLVAAVAADAQDVEAVLAAPAGDGTVQDLVDNMGAVIGEKIGVRRIARVSGDNVGLYLHRTNPDLPPQLGVFVVTDENAKDVARDIAMHVAMYRPGWLDRESVPTEVADKERDTLTKLTLQDGKPEAIVPKIVEGRMNAFYKENCLVDQDFAKDPSLTVGKVLAGKNGKVTEFVRYQVGA